MKPEEHVADYSVESGMASGKGEWKHCWEGVGTPTEVLDTRGKRSYRQKYVCKTCGAEITARCSSKIRTSVWKKQGVLLCSEELVKNVHSL